MKHTSKSLDYVEKGRIVKNLIIELERKKGVTISLKEMIRLAIKHGWIKEIKKAIPIKVIISEATKNKSISREDVLNLLKGLKEDAFIYEPKRGLVRRM